MIASLTQFLRELRRRKVARVAAAYIVVGIGVVEGADVLGTPLGLQAWVIQAVDLLVVLGFPIALVLAWALELTPDGVRVEGDEGVRDAGLLPGQRSVLPTLAALVFSVTLAGGYLLFLRPGGEAASSVDYRVGVLPLRNRTGDDDFDRLGEMAAHWIIDGVSRLPRAEVVPAEVAFSFSAAHGTQTAGTVPEDPLREFADATGAGLVVSGSYYAQGDSVLFNLELTDTRSGRGFGMISGRSTAGATMEAVDDLRSRVMAALAIRLDPEGSWAEVLSPSSDLPVYEAYRAFTEGLDAFWRFDYPAAHERLTRAVELDSGFVPAKLWLARTLIQDNFQGMSFASATELLASISDNLERLAPLDRAFYDYLQAYVATDLPGVFASWERIVEVAPQVAGFITMLGQYAIDNGHYQRAIEVLGDVRPDQLGYNYSVGRLLAEAHHRLGQHEAALEVLRSARERFPDRQALFQSEVRELAALGRVDAVRQWVDEVEDLGPEAPASAGLVLRWAAGELLLHGYPGPSRELAEEAVVWYGSMEIPDSAGLAQALYLGGRPAEAWAIARDLEGRTALSVGRMGTFGVLAAAAGEREEAQRFSDRLDVGWAPELLGMNELWRARIAAEMGNKDLAVELLKKAFDEGCPYVRLYAHGYPLPALVGYPPYEAFMRPRG